MNGPLLRSDRPGSAIFVCPSPNFRVSGDDFAAGVGGTVAATILMAETLAQRGWEVLVASAVERELKFEGVRYAPMASTAGAKCDLLALVNNWGETVDSIDSQRRLFLYHDTRFGGQADTARCVEWADKTIVDSDFGREQLFPGLPSSVRDRVVVQSLPIRVGDYRDATQKKENRILYSSMPDRGLSHLAKWFPGIRERIPDAELHVTGDFTMYGWPSGREGYEKMFAGVSGVHYHGRVSRSELVDLQRSSKVFAFPCTFPEGFCIAAAEAMAAGTIPVTSNAFALRTTVGTAGVLIPGHPGGGRRRAVQKWIYGRRFIRAIVKLLTDQDHWRSHAQACRLSAESRFSTEAWSKGFLGLLG